MADNYVAEDTPNERIRQWVFKKIRGVTQPSDYPAPQKPADNDSDLGAMINRKIKQRIEG